MQDIVIPGAVIARLQANVHFDTTEDVQGFIADALNTYLHLGWLAANGTEILASEGHDAPLVRLRFPFSTPNED